jgi:uncharacterized surface protein with fasciclin (FAS1) repeats
MKKETWTRRMNSRSLLLTGIAALAIFLVSCEKYEDDPMQADALKRAEAANNAAEAKKTPAKGDLSIGAIAIDAAFNEENPLYPQFTELVAALSYVDAELNAGLVDLFVNGSDQYTVFAPVDQAFYDLYDAFGVSSIEEAGAALGAETILNVLLYHVTEGRRASNSVVPPRMPRQIETLLGESFMVYPLDSDEDNIEAIGNTANFVSLDLIDISASNGIIHVIDTVILPL